MINFPFPQGPVAPVNSETVYLSLPIPVGSEEFVLALCALGPLFFSCAVLTMVCFSWPGSVVSLVISFELYTDHPVPSHMLVAVPTVH